MLRKDVKGATKTISGRRYEAPTSGCPILSAIMVSLEPEDHVRLLPTMLPLQH